jgi:iron-sulfur cluster repair protein YtfE (RIC family)
MQTQRALPSHVQSGLAEDHDRLDNIFSRVADLVELGDLDRARAGYVDFEAGLERHIRFEEERLFPLFIERSGIRGGPVVVMLHEHRAIERALDEMRRALESGDVRGFREGRLHLECVLPGHNLKEERALYPMIDSLITGDEGKALLADFARS